MSATTERPAAVPIQDNMIVQHYVEEIGDADHLRLVSHSDLFTPSGRTKIDVVWDLSVTKIDEQTCEFTNTVHSSAPPEMLDFLGKQGIPLDVFRAGRRPISEAHNRAAPVSPASPAVRRPISDCYANRRTSRHRLWHRAGLS